jgi:hypothetical protein
MIFTKEEEHLRATRRTTFYQTVVFTRMKSSIMNSGVRLVRAAASLGLHYSDVRMFLSKPQKEELEELSKLYGRNIKKSSVTR